MKVLYLLAESNADELSFEAVAERITGFSFIVLMSWILNNSRSDPQVFAIFANNSKIGSREIMIEP